jgi:hypothetical protein
MAKSGSARSTSSLRPLFTFIYNYFFRLGFLDGREGLLLHLYHAVYVSWKYAKAWELSRNSQRAAGTAVTDSDWQRLFATEPYIRLQKREAAMHRDFNDDDFKTFVLSPGLAEKASAPAKDAGCVGARRSRRLSTPRSGLPSGTSRHQSQSLR